MSPQHEQVHATVMGDEPPFCGWCGMAIEPGDFHALVDELPDMDGHLWVRCHRERQLGTHAALRPASSTSRESELVR